MLDTDTKRRINTCRDILVGKVPDPKSQVEQITIALIYKFMDDMDLESEEMGGTRTFFAGEFERYAWAKLVAPGVGGQEMLNTYTEALTKMVENPGIPELFRSIFRNAYLPYRDPETLRSFLREINGFTYDHSERLGDAFEYLLSVLGSQGDAGQFRTPRHIIDFMVEIIDPKKGEVILDPACGTAGFLISSYKHVLKANSTDAAGGNGNGAEVDAAEATLDSPLRYAGDLLTPDDRQRLANNIKGYDISPDMVRLSLVNLYLHGFADPKVEEYDTLTSDDKWGETADVILANPPFMSPKGGIKPHNRFQVLSKRSEVLFVDYMAEHLNPNGRAAIVVPEGIIFQSQSAYCELRKMLVDGRYLAAVISLPAGVFNPYSGVKTSVLILDRAAAKASDSVAFFKVENDGFGLGAQRRAMKGSQLPQVKAELRAWLAAQRGGEDTALASSLGHTVGKARIAEGGDYNLSGERYRGDVQQSAHWPMATIGDLCEIARGASPRPIQDFMTTAPDGVNWIKIGDAQLGTKFISKTKEKVSPEGAKRSRYVKPGDFILSNSMSFGRPYIMATDGCIHDGWLLLRPKAGDIDQDYLYHILGSQPVYDQFVRQARGGVVNNLNSGIVAAVEIPLPPLEVQREIVAEIEGYQKVIDGARAVLENYRPHIPIDPDWPMVELGKIIDRLETGVSVNSENRQVRPGEHGILKTSCVTLGIFDPSEHKAILPDELDRAKCSPKGDSIIISRMNTEALVGASAYIHEDHPNLYLPDRLWQTVISREDVSTHYVYQIIASDAYRAKISAICGGTSGSMKNIAKPALMGIEIPLPPLEIQQAIVADIEADQALVAGNRELIARFEMKIENAIARVWGRAAGSVAVEAAA
jgi:type I restriction enzyme M protein